MEESETEPEPVGLADAVLLPLGVGPPVAVPFPVGLLPPVGCGQSKPPMVPPPAVLPPARLLEEVASTLGLAVPVPVGGPVWRVRVRRELPGTEVGAVALDFGGLTVGTTAVEVVGTPVG